MNQDLFSVFDNKAKAFITPFFAPNCEVAVRSFGEAAKDSSHAFARSPNDYVLFHIGNFDNVTGCLFSLPQHINLGSAAIHRNAAFDFSVSTLGVSSHE